MRCLFIGYNSKRTKLINFLKKKKVSVIYKKRIEKKGIEKFDLIISFGFRRIIKSDINEMNIDHSLSCVLIKNFSNKIVSKLSFEDKISYIVNVIRKRVHESIPIFILTGSNALKTEDFSAVLKKSLRSDFIVTKIQTPFFDTNRYLLEIRYV